MSNIVRVFAYDEDGMGVHDVEIVHLSEDGLLALLDEHLHGSDIRSLEIKVSAQVPTTLLGRHGQDDNQWAFMGDGFSVRVKVTPDYPLPMAIERFVVSVGARLAEVSRCARYEMDRAFAAHSS